MKIEFTTKKFTENDGSITLALGEIDIIENGVTEQDAKVKLAAAILEYENDFCKEYNYWSIAENRKAHIPYVLKTKNMTTDDIIKLIK